MQILHIDSAITGEASVSRKLTADIIAKLKAANPDAAVTYRDLNAGVPAIDTDWFHAVRLAPESPTAGQRRLIETADAYLAEVRDADVLVIGSPVYNFAITAQLKNWLDQIARAGLSFRYTEAGPEGLLKGKRAIIAYSSAGTPLGSDLDFASGYLRHILGFLGITDVEFVAADRLAMDREAGLARARQAVDNLAA
ncbi:MAG: NAD(P)H-dependent oxidoreductase [Paracoccus sp. (in: a-proteobacteria)]|jgi:FMN-dependent NADH-azoreductase|uniref:FMN-dependent NADH-azoreductase n=1 Tax=unclassified Paracoccus (in: a-proteobacteria) TaxID=2688777 RepID=UPI000C3EE314|nr:MULTISPECIES: NAD(P)H-dependent oxidoreductase [unclassified Paracoccus (in: a-proteobacteria)]MAL27016.1 FMN-dependent NADH-azoreductase [Croceicoccus sp.]MBA49500.1 FMN-dependent NADH-azoreductase [Paracoccus sp. (in: a-proteobacteria)]MCS5601051.1 NAD(P)H-dependent oxidoreductase [Paracoccus sp. (in: a-proteobacteria)]HIC66569.1 FMN-dependent NADH-azoreductase [Paracoccus sp. (in: a-proteobacteria)]|tara:strand:+ start:707 stop:1294 length:588 start_codon:yes stop_codon:yes gene_type:complete